MESLPFVVPRALGQESTSLATGRMRLPMRSALFSTISIQIHVLTPSQVSIHGDAWNGRQFPPQKPASL